MSCDTTTIPLLLALLEGSTHANALRANGKPCRILLPEDPADRAVLAEAHVSGARARLAFHAKGIGIWHEEVQPVVLAAYCPSAEHCCRWVAIDLDGSDHGHGGLASPVHAARLIAERASYLGLDSGLVVARSRRGHGRHAFLLLPQPTSLVDSVIGVAALVASSVRAASSDAAEGNVAHAFRCENGESRATWKREPLKYDGLDAAVARGREVLKDNPALVAELLRTGKERALMFRVLALTGLRKGELASLTVGQVEFAHPVAHVILNPADEKNRRGSSIPLRPDLAAELSSWLGERRKVMQHEARQKGMPIPARLPPSTRLFHVPSGLTRIFDRDLTVAGIPKRDDRNRVVDIHALRVTFGTHLCAAGVPLRTAQAAMRHSKPELTANVYTDPRLLDVAGAVAKLPAMAIISEIGELSAQANA